MVSYNARWRWRESSPGQRSHLQHHSCPVIVRSSVVRCSIAMPFGRAWPEGIFNITPQGGCWTNSGLGGVHVLKDHLNGESDLGQVHDAVDGGAGGTDDLGLEGDVELADRVSQGTSVSAEQAKDLTEL